MKLAIISDTHFGFQWESERREDCFRTAEEAFKLAIQEKADAVLLPGDIFDGKTPRPEVWEKALKCFRILKEARYEYAKLKNGRENPAEEGVPVIAIHGTHELRQKDFKNPIEILDAGNFLKHIHLKKVHLEKNNEETVVYGMSGVPEKYAKTILESWHPQAEPGKSNIIMFHQSFKEILPFEDEETVFLSLNDLPPGFDLYIDGHIHWKQEIKLDSGAYFLIPGSTIQTQMKKLESKTPKGIYFYDTTTKELSFKELETVRELFYNKIRLNEASLDDITTQVRDFVQNALNNKTKNMKPLIRIKLTGSLTKGLKPSDIDLKHVLNPFEGKAIFSVTKDLYSQGLKQRIHDIKNKASEKPSVDELGLQLLTENLKQMQFSETIPGERLFALLANKDVETAWKLVQEELSKEPPAPKLEESPAEKKPETSIQNNEIKPFKTENGLQTREIKFEAKTATKKPAEPMHQRTLF